jgi:CxxC-x17-CxxC domain-containing protein
VCRECHATFVFSAGEQAFFARRGLREPPRRCRRCLAADQRRVAAAPSLRGRPRRTEPHLPATGAAEAAPRAARALFDAACATCGAATQIPFRPAHGRPVHCRECYSARQEHGSGYEGSR